MPALVGLCLGAHALFDSDAFWHLMLGRAVLRAHARIVPEPTALLAFEPTCHVKEWLWDVLTYGVQQLGGITALSLLPAAFGALLGYRVARYVELRAGGALRPIHCVLAVLPVCAVAEVLDVRPNLALFSLLVALFELTARYAANGGAARTRLGLGLVLLVLAWVQLHSSCVLAPALFALCLLDARLAQRRDPELRAALRADGLVLCGMLLALTTGAYGLQVAQLVVDHAAGDSARHITDMRRFDWAEFTPLYWHVPAIVLLLAGVGVLGVISGGAVSPSGLALAALGGAMTFAASRFVFVWSLLLLPWALSGLSALEARPLHRLQGLCLALALPLVGWSALHVDAHFGPLFHFGLREGDHPRASARLLARLPRGTRVFTQYTLGAPLGFWLDGHARTYVDSRTMLYFDPTDFALSRDMQASAFGLERAIQRYGFEAAVVERDSGVCSLLAARFIPVLVEARHTTFVAPERAGQLPRVRGLAPCGPLYLAPDACAHGGSELERSVADQRRFGDSAFLKLMAAAGALQCRGRPAPLASLPAASESRSFRSVWRLYRAWALLLAGQLPEALAAIDAGLDAGDPLAARVLLEPAAGGVSLTDARRVLTRALEQMDDSAPPALRARLALVCMAEGDAECVRYQGLRARAFGDRSATPTLLWAADHHPDARVRADLRAWLVLEQPEDRTARKP